MENELEDNIEDRSENIIKDIKEMSDALNKIEEAKLRKKEFKSKKNE